MDYRRASVHPRASVFAGRPSVLDPGASLSLFLPGLEAAIEATETCGDIVRVYLYIYSNDYAHRV